MEKEIYLKKSLKQIPRILSLQERDISSPNYGCFDRSFWAWKFKDFPDASPQRAVYPLSLIYSLNFDNNPYLRNENLAEWIKAGILYWAKIQHKNGSFDQAFPQEFSFGATAFTLYPLIESFLILKEKFSLVEEKNMLNAIDKAADFLLKHGETHGFISNHLSGAALALYRAGELLENEKYKEQSRKIINLILKNQSQEGWFKEYEGPDPGYETLGIYYLAKYYGETKDEKVLEALRRSIDFLSYFIHPDGTLGGEYGSRNTEIFYPAGFEIIKKEISIAGKIIKAISEEKTVCLEGLDNENLIPLMENYLEAYLAEAEENQLVDFKLPFEEIKERFFEEAKIYVKSSPLYYLICNAAKGGVVKVFDKKKKGLIFEDAGFLGETVKGKIITSQIFNDKAKIDFKEGKLEIATHFSGVLGEGTNPLKFIILRMLNLTLFNNVFLGNLIKAIMIKRLITKKKKYPVWLKRKIVFKENKIEINDILTKKQNIRLEWLEYGKKFSAIHMGSAKYFQLSQLIQKEKPTMVDLDKFNKENEITVKNIFEFK
ncbi:MAG: hypothetical protein PHE52_00590 [Candidatus Pacebacteria bacterium]|nr:hypothetical protein [Candidatus Paceibacterota bacterium]